MNVTALSRIACFWTGLIGLTCLAPAAAQQSQALHPYLTEKFFVSAGVFFPDRTLRFELDGALTGMHQVIDFSEQFRIDGTDEAAAFEFGWRFGDDWSLRTQHFRVDDSGTAVLDEDIEWGDALFAVGSTVMARTDVEVTRLFFAWQYREGEASEFGIGGGLHLLDIEASLSGNALVDGQPAGFFEEAADTQGPMPNFGAWYAWSMSADWLLNVRFDWLSVSIDKYDGKIINAAAGVNYVLSKTVGLGLNYNYFELNVGVTDPPWRGRIYNRFHGPYLSLTAHW